MKLIRLIAALLLTLSLCSCVFADPLVQTEDLSGTLCWPADADPADAVYVYTYRYPQVLGEEEAVLAINAHFAYEITDAEIYRVPMFGEMVPEGEREETDVSYTITCSSDTYFSVLITTADRYQGETFTILSAQVFSRNTDKAGSIITLPYLLGILEGTEADAWMLQRQKEKADACVRDLVLERMEATPGQWLDGVDSEYLSAIFYPEEDFYLDASGDPVFFVQPGMIAPEEEGPQLFPIPLEELLDEI
ncbi:MAG: hypothetical protein IKP40_07940 [Clostridia bacterium]|nr:hypothetical protein [Clostridia bacterium]